MHFYSWGLGLKTGCYYLRSQAKTAAQKFSVDLEQVKKENNTETMADTKADVVVPVAKVEEKQEPECLMCSS